MNAFLRAVEIVGNQQKLATYLTVTPGAINAVCKGRRGVPARWAPLIERATGGAVRCEQLRPDIDWAIVRQSGEEKTK